MDAANIASRGKVGNATGGTIASFGRLFSGILTVGGDFIKITAVMIAEYIEQAVTVIDSNN